MAPTLASSTPVYSAARDTSTLSSGSISANAGDVFIIKLVAEDTPLTIAAPTCSGQTVALIASSTAASNCPVSLYKMTVSGSPGTVTISCTFTGSGRWHMAVFNRWTGCTIAGTPAVNATKTGGTTPSATLTTTAANSAIDVSVGDWNAVAPGTPAYRLSAVQDALHDKTTANYAGYGFHTLDAGATGAKTIGMTAPTGQAWTMIGVEILASGGSGTDAPAEAATHTAAAQDATTAVSPAATDAQVAIAGQNPSSAIAAPAEHAPASVTAQNPTTAVAPAAEAVTLGWAAQDATVSTTAGTDAAAQSATIGYAAQDLTATVATTAGSAPLAVEALFDAGSSIGLELTADAPIEVTLAAQDATVSTSSAGTASAAPAAVTLAAVDASTAIAGAAEAAVLSVAAEAPSGTISSTTAQATVGFAGQDATGSTSAAGSAPAGVAATTFLAADPSAAVAAPTGLAAATLAAEAATPTVGASAASPTVGVAAQDATVSASSTGTGSAESAPIDAVAWDASTLIAPVVEHAPVGMSAQNAATVAGVSAFAGLATVGVTSADPASAVLVDALTAAATVQALNALALLPVVRGSMSHTTRTGPTMTHTDRQVATMGVG